MKSQRKVAELKVLECICLLKLVTEKAFYVIYSYQHVFVCILSWGKTQRPSFFLHFLDLHKKNPTYAADAISVAKKCGNVIAHFLSLIELNLRLFLMEV
jgi:hypothetical protein